MTYAYWRGYSKLNDTQPHAKRNDPLITEEDETNMVSYPLLGCKVWKKNWDSLPCFWRFTTCWTASFCCCCWIGWSSIQRGFSALNDAQPLYERSDPPIMEEGATDTCSYPLGVQGVTCKKGMRASVLDDIDLTGNPLLYCVIQIKCSIYINIADLFSARLSVPREVFPPKRLHDKIDGLW